MEPSSWPGHFRNLGFRNLGLAQRELALPASMGNDYNASFCWALLLAQHLVPTNLRGSSGKAVERVRSEV
jgi:hypothetical protein